MTRQSGSMLMEMTVLTGDAGNLANVLRTLRETEAYETILENLKGMFDQVSTLSTNVDRGRVLLLLKEKAFKDPIEAVALSDGTLRLLAMFTRLKRCRSTGFCASRSPSTGCTRFFSPRSSKLSGSAVLRAARVRSC